MATPSNLAEILPAEQPTSTVHKIFLGSSGLRAGWRLLIFLVLFSALVFVARSLMVRVPVIHQVLREGQRGTVSPLFEFVFETSVILALLIATATMSRIEHRSFADYGLPLKNAFGMRFWQGAVWGLAMESLIILAISAFHGFTFGPLALSGIEIVKYGILWALAFVLVGVFEEFLFRGYAQFTSATGIGFWPAAISLSALFGAVHLGNPGEGWIGALSVMLFALFACLTLKRTGSLWFAIGLHAAVDYAETFLFSVPDSGMLARGHLLNSTLQGPRWLTGGSIGPEGSVMDFLVVLLAFALFAWLYPAHKAGVAPMVPEVGVQPV